MQVGSRAVPWQIGGGIEESHAVTTIVRIGEPPAR